MDIKTLRRAVVSQTLVQVCERAMGQAIKDAADAGIEINDTDILTAVSTLAIECMAKSCTEAEWLHVLRGFLGEDTQAAMRETHREFRKSKGAPVELLGEQPEVDDGPARPNCN